jgi:hypothetical protein
MKVFLERPRIAAAAGIALVAFVVVATLAGGALAGDGDCSTASGTGSPPRTQP